MSWAGYRSRLSLQCKPVQIGYTRLGFVAKRALVVSEILHQCYLGLASALWDHQQRCGFEMLFFVPEVGFWWFLVYWIPYTSEMKYIGTWSMVSRRFETSEWALTFVIEKLSRALLKGSSHLFHLLTDCTTCSNTSSDKSISVRNSFHTLIYFTTNYFHFLTDNFVRVLNIMARWPDVERFHWVFANYVSKPLSIFILFY